jgi:hypothetical protein
MAPAIGRHAMSRGRSMLELTCWGCGWDGRVPVAFAGLRVTCKRCRAVNAVPDPVTQEVYVADWLAEIDRPSLPVTVESEIPAAIRAAV